MRSTQARRSRRFEHRGRRVCYTQMRRKNAKMGMQGNKESVRGVVGEQKTTSTHVWDPNRAAQEYRAIKTRLPNSWSTEGIGL